MLSVLIPVYNYNVTTLVGELHRQLTDALVDFEIIVMEDGSALCLEENETVGALPHCTYIPLAENIGRSAIRNKLADASRYEHLLFLDCDAELPNQYFIQKYLSFCHEECVVLGGRIYKNRLPAEYSLISAYGRDRERNDAKNRKEKERHRMFTSPNFLISKSIFNAVRFDESIRGYGHEDTVFGIMLRRKDVEFKYIDNPVVHVGIEDNRTFIEKTESALSNLFCLYQSGLYPELQNDSKILSFYLSLRKLHLVGAFACFHRCFKGVWQRNLMGESPSLFVFDVYKLGALCACSLQKQTCK